jgi:kynurenine formamidase
MNPHGNGTHTECVGHIAKEFYSINKCLTEFHFLGNVVTVEPEIVFNSALNVNDNVITRKALSHACAAVIDEIKMGKTLIIRTNPNDESKLSFNYSNTNPTYFEKGAIEYINDLGVIHLMVDLPSIDREEDQGALVGHHTFWNYPQNPQIHKTITELIYVPDSIFDGRYMVNIQITSLENDASPSKITLYHIQKIKKL